MLLCLTLLLLQPIDTPVSFIRDVAPILRENCMACHNAEKHKGSFDMTSFVSLTKGGDRGAVLVAGKPDESPLWCVCSGKEEPLMPPKEAGGKMPDAKIALLERWIKEGAKFDGKSTEASIASELRHLWNPPAPPEKYTMPAVIRALCYSADGKFLFIGGHHEVLIWSVKPSKLLARLQTRAERINAITLLKDGKTLVIAGGRPGQEGEVRTYTLPELKDDNVQTLIGTTPGQGACTSEILALDDEALCLALNKEGTKLAIGSTDRKIRLYSTANFSDKPKILTHHADWVNSITFSDDGKLLLSASRDRTVKIWDLQADKQLLLFPDHQNNVYSVAIRSDGKQALSGGEDHQLRTWTPAAGGKQIRAYPAFFTKGITQVLYRPGKSQAVAASADGTVRLINPENGASVFQMKGHSDWVFALALSPDAKYIASAAWNGEVRIFDLDTGKEHAAFQASPGKELKASIK